MTLATVDPADVADRVRAVLGSVWDPEYPDVSIAELGMVESVRVDPDGSTVIGLVPTYSGCPALRFIAADVEAAVMAVEGVATCEVEWLRSTVWTTDRLRPGVAARLEREFTVTLRRADGTLRCPVCGADADDTSMAGPTRCRSLAYCSSCRNPVEVMR